MYINKPSVTKIKAADRVNLLHSTSCRFEQCKFRKPSQMLVSLPKYLRHFMIVTKKLLLSDIEIKHLITLLNPDRF